MKILIIGANGFVARNLYEYFCMKPEHEVRAISGSELDALDEEAVYLALKEIRYNVVIHCAIYHPKTRMEELAGKELEYDLRMFYNFARYYDLYDRMIYFGSGAEYDKRQPIQSAVEGRFVNQIPGNHYGFAKYIIGQQIEGSANIYNLRIFGLFGKYENWKSTFISGACCKAVKNLPITIRKNVFFDYLYIDDFCDMLDRFLSLEAPQYHTYNIVSGRRIDLISLAQIVKSVSGKEIPIIVCEEGLANEYTADNSRLLHEIGEVSFSSYEEAIRKLYRWYADREKDIDLLSLLY